MRSWVLIALLACAGPAGASTPPKGKAAGLAIRATFEESAEPLTTEAIWATAPDEINAHRRRWILERRTQLSGVEAKVRAAAAARAPGAFGVRAASLDSIAVGRIRGPGPWYRPIEEFPCSARPAPGFGTAEGAREAAREASRIWKAELEAQAPALEILLARISEPAPEAALARADRVFREWLATVEAAWRGQASEGPRRKEWELYVKASARAHACENPERRPLPRWEEMMEPPAGPLPERPLVRAPARRWDGPFSVRVTVHVGGKRVSGNFLVDSASPFSLISPAFLEDQGVHRIFQALPGDAPPKGEVERGTEVGPAASDR